VFGGKIRTNRTDADMIMRIQGSGPNAGNPEGFKNGRIIPGRLGIYRFRMRNSRIKALVADFWTLLPTKGGSWCSRATCSIAPLVA